ncbi:MAG: hypothetical protein IJD70_04645 [Clostridia bacterium]|nr:hypothetical protein [Clostridia bacterium]
MKRLYLFLTILILTLSLAACSGNGEVTTDPSASNEGTPAPETKPLNTEPLESVTVENPDWGYKAFSLSVSDETIVKAELDKSTGNVNLTSFNPGEAEVYVHDCFDHKAVIKVSVAEGGKITYEASPCTEEFINAKDFGVIAGKSTAGLPDLTTQMQKAIDHAYKQGGGTVYLYPGFYNIKLISMREGVTLKMYSGFTDAREGYTKDLAEKVDNGEVTVLILTRILSTDFNDYGRNSAKNFTISGGVIDNCRSTQSTLLFGLSENITIENAIFKDIKNNHVIQITGCNNVTIRNCIFAGFEWGDTFTRETIQIEQSHPGSHSGNHAGAPQRFDYGEMYGCDNVVIDSCYFGPSDELPGAHIAIGHHGTAHEAVCDGFKITNNVFDSPTYAAIRFANIVDVEITGNKFIAGKLSNKFCSEENPAFIILYPNTSNITYNNIVNGQKVTKAISNELSGTHNVNISNNEFLVTPGSDKRIAYVTGTSITPGVIHKAGVVRQDTYDSKIYALTGYFKSTNYTGNINFSDNKITYEGQPTFADCILFFSLVYGLRIENNSIDLKNCNFKCASDGVAGLQTTGCRNGEAAETYKIDSKAVKQFVSIPHADGSTAQLVFNCTASHYLIAGEGGRIELSSDTKGNVYVEVIANEGYSFVGWTTSAGDFKETGTYTVSSEITLKAAFKKN